LFGFAIIFLGFVKALFGQQQVGVSLLNGLWLARPLQAGQQVLGQRTILLRLPHCQDGLSQFDFSQTVKIVQGLLSQQPNSATERSA
jgi:hypothetical protein